MRPIDRFSPSFVSSLLSYDPNTGELTWKHRDVSTFCSGKQDATRIAAWWNAMFAGTSAGTTTKYGYRNVKIEGVGVRAHRIAWAIMTGAWPEQYVDHKDGDKLNNAWANLRQATKSQNGANRKIHKNNASGLKGVTWSDSAGAYTSQIRLNGELTLLHTSACPAAAYLAYVVAADKHFGEFARFA